MYLANSWSGVLPRQPQSALTALKGICNRHRYTAIVAAMLRMSLHHVSIKVLNSHSHHRTLCFPAGLVPKGALQCSTNSPESSLCSGWLTQTLSSHTHADRNTPDVTDQPWHRTSSGTGCQLSSELHPVNIPKTESGLEVWTLKGFALWGAAVSLMRKFDYVWDPTSRHAGTDLGSILHQR